MNISENNFNALLAAAVSLWVALLTYLVLSYQAKTERLRLRHELYDRRIKIFQATMAFLGHILREAKIDLPQILGFNWAVEESYFLFGAEMRDYLWQLHLKAVELRKLISQQSTLPMGTERNEAINAESKLHIWFGDQLEAARVEFAKHMSLRE